ncbi:DUF2760 domain-containing protein [Pseudomaricurvus alkylphenolicus]|uniref:DUF2760 domain-containing protein n=1 Tax=Pseudomaricurvus alkylphenolicus TaxID=1306991 RepID=UPI00142036F0|nr:DUF2760 domain-containing protein [Pseudomaricurvus alkylphenolicus]NIB40863.1 DUF2760 domain-containing protein [Pseudomaricurvus alkylphenolicus]
MQVDLTSFPQSLDALHLILAVFAGVLLVSAILRGQSDSTEPEATEPTPQAPAPQPKTADKPVELLDTNPTSALQLLSLLQQESRFIDFVQEDLSNFGDADVGAAARVVHTGAKKVLDNYFELSPVSSQQEESRVTLEPGFNASENRLTGNVVGEAPFTGTLVHKGWKAEEVNLPKLAPGHNARVLAPAEIEL